MLEGGCGQGQIVHALQVQGYKAIELEVRIGDVRNLPVDDASVDGYVSAGVIEHFWEGYARILSEMFRVLRPGGYLFLTFPYMSFLRRTKAFFRLYESSSSDEQAEKADRFYQFALAQKTVERDLVRTGFEILNTISHDGIKGFKDEVPFGRSRLQAIYDGKRGQKVRPFLDRLLKPFAGHIVLIVARKQTQKEGLHD